MTQTEAQSVKEGIWKDRRMGKREQKVFGLVLVTQERIGKGITDKELKAEKYLKHYQQHHHHYQCQHKH